jgi:SAM-dependent methyltransferase/uncharacterized protein YbaR (Trm112 family)
MRSEILERGLLRAIPGGEPLSLEAYSSAEGHVVEGVLRQPDGYWYPIVDGVPSFLRGVLRPDLEAFEKRHGLQSVSDQPARHAAASEQLKTNTTFSDKWRRFRRYGLDAGHGEFLFGWYCKKLGVPDVDALKQFYAGKRAVLEVGPGSGFNTRFMAENCPGSVFAADISDAAHTTYENTRHLPNCHVIQGDLMELPFPDGTFDFVIADGVLHHTPDTRAAFEALLRKVKPGGQFFFYVYRKMGAARQFTDDHIRKLFTPLDPEACYAACEGLTELGRELARVGAKIRLEKGVPALGIPPGEHDVQRLVYYNFVKCFWNEAFDFETNNMVNFDWYHPHNAWQHTEEEVAGWLAAAGVREYRFNDANPNGISVLLTRPS